MPAVGDQHKSNGPVTANPFEVNKPQTTLYTAAEIATLQARLDKQLGPEFISSRPGASGQKVHYLAGEKVINLANEVFGFNGWSSAIQNIQIDFVDEHAQTGKISLGLSVIVRVTLKDGTYHEDVGYGHIENCKGKAAAFAKAKKEGTTDALKRALRTFGKVLGNCIYDQEFLGRVTKMKVGKGRWDESELYRHSDFAPVKIEEVNGVNENKTAAHGSSNTIMASTVEPEVDMDESFNIADFDDAEFGDEEFGDPDQIVLPESRPLGAGRNVTGTNQQMAPPSRNGTAAPSRPPTTQTAPPAVTRGQNIPSQGNCIPQHRPTTGPGAMQATKMTHPAPNEAQPQAETQQHSSNEKYRSSSPGIPSQNLATQTNNTPNQHQLQQNGPFRPAAFYSARAATDIDPENNIVSAKPNSAPKFNPHAESPSIRKTAGVDHRRSAPLRRDIIVKDVGALAPGSASNNFIDPKTDQTRRLGIPGQGAVSPVGKAVTPGMGTSAYRPPSRRTMEPPTYLPGVGPAGQGMPGGVDRALAVEKRAPLSDLSNVQHSVTAVTADGADAKRIRITGPGQSLPCQMDGAVDGVENVGVTLGSGGAV